MPREGIESLIKSHLYYELRLLYYRPDMTSGERLVVGVVAFDRNNQEVACVMDTDGERVRRTWPSFDMEAYRTLAATIAHRCQAVQTDMLGIRSLDQVCNRIVMLGSGNWVWSESCYGVTFNIQERAEQVFEEYADRRR